MTVVDANVVLTALLDAGEAGRRVRARLRGEPLQAPSVIDLEVASVLRRQAAAGLISDAEAWTALADLAVLPVQRSAHDALLVRCWELRRNLSVYDASYVALAELLGTTLVTADGRLARAPGLRCAVELLSTSPGRPSTGGGPAGP